MSMIWVSVWDIASDADLKVLHSACVNHMGWFGVALVCLMKHVGCVQVLVLRIAMYVV